MLGRVDVVGLTALRTAPSHRVLRVTLGDGHRLVLKLGEAGHPLAVQGTAAALALARDRGVPAPAVVAAGATDDGLPFLLLEHLEGVPWRDASLGEHDRARLQGELAGAVLALRRIRFHAFGELDAEGRPVATDLATALAGRAERIQDRADRADLLGLLRRNAALFAGPEEAVLVHDDLHPGNLLLRTTADGPRLAGVLDWDKAWAGPADADAARLAFWDGMTGPGFWAVLGGDAARHDERAARRRTVLQLLWALEYADPSPRHRADTALLRARAGVG